MHVGLFVDSFFPIIDGVTRIVDAYASRLVQKCDVTVFTAAIPNVDPAYDSRFPYQVVRCLSHMGKNDDYAKGFPHLDPKFNARIRADGLDLIHVHSAFSLGLSAKSSAKRLDIPMVGTIHSDFRPDVIQYLGKPLGEAAIRLMMSIYNACDECWTVNDAVGRMFCQEYGLKRPYRTMPYSTDHKPVQDVAAARKAVNAAYGLKDDDFVLAHVGRQDLQKREDFILRSLALLKNKQTPFRMLFVGDGNKQGFLKKLSAELRLEDQVTFCGAITDPQMLMNVYARTDLLLFPSVSDTYGLVKIEAACQQTPTLYCEGTMATDGITRDVNGFMVANDEEAFAARICELYHDHRLLEEVGAGAFRDLYRTWDNLVDEVYENYKIVIENHNFVKF